MAELRFVFPSMERTSPGRQADQQLQNGSRTMKPFSVWIRPLGTDGKVRVENIASTTWLLNRLSRFFVFKGSESVNEEECFPCCTFRAVYGSQMNHALFRKILDGIPEVRMMADPA
jgi:hypothetical protein